MRDGSDGDAVLDALGRIDELRRRGLDAEGIAAEMTAAGAPVPTGGDWTAATVERILDVFDAVRAKGEVAEPAPAPVEPPSQPGHAAEPVAAQPEPVEPAAAESVAVGTGAVIDGRSRRSLVVSALRWSLTAVTLAAVGAGGFLAIDRIVTVSSTETRLSGDAATATTAALSPTTQPPNPADTMAIRIETDDAGTDPEADRDPDELQPATATIRTDGRLYVEGAFSTAAEARAFVDEAAEVFGRDNVVEAFVVDEAAPDPTVTDVALDKPVLFESGTAVIDPEYIDFLEACAGVLELHPHIVMSITAYTDSVGDEDVNLELSQRRAQAIVDFYRDREIGDDQLVASGVGERDPVASNDTDAGRSQNRRAMLELLNVVGGQAAGVGGQDPTG